MIYIGADHAGFDSKEAIKQLLSERNLDYTDSGAHTKNPTDDYPDFAFPVAEKISEGANTTKTDFGILICGSGAGMAMCANKVKGVRAALATNEYMATKAREDDDANILVLAARVNTEQELLAIVDAFLEAQFQQDRHSRRLQKMVEYEQQHLSRN